MNTGLDERIARWTGQRNQLDTDIAGLTLHRWQTPTEPTSYTLPPSVCLIGQGRKRVTLGERSFDYDTNSLLITSVDLPVVAQIVEASADAPYLGLTLALDQQAIAQLIMDRRLPAPAAHDGHLGIAVSRVAPPLLDAIGRLIGLLDEPDNIPALAPLIKAEIFYRLLTSEHGPRLRQIVSADGRGFRISQAIDWLRDNFDKAVRVEELAKTVGMGTSTLHNHFRSVTSMSPLQFQKRIRLNEARRLMLTERIDASSAAYRVGYESPSQFSREYSRLFGAPPLRDIRNLQHASAAALQASEQR